MTRISLLSSPLLLGFEEMERLIDRVGKTGRDGYPPYNTSALPAPPQTLATLDAICASPWP